MVEERITDGRRIAELLASELDGRTDGALSAVAVTDPDPDVDGSVDGERAYGVAADDRPLASVYVHADRARIEVRAGRDAAAASASDAGLRVRPLAADPPRTLVFVESGAAVKRAVDALAAAAGASRTSGDPGE